MSDSNVRQGPDRAALVVAALLFIVAGLVGFDANSLTIGSTYGMGPKAMPYVISGGLIILGFAHVITAFKEGIPVPDPVDPKAIAWLAGGLLGLIACIGLGGGFILATATVFAATARAFGRNEKIKLRTGFELRLEERPITLHVSQTYVDFAIGLVLGLVIYLAFAKGLTLSLPQGPLEKLI